MVKMPGYWDRKYSGGNFEWGQEPSFVGRLALQTALEYGLNDALDIGCGYGRDVLYLAQNGLQAAGIDMAGTGVAMARQRAVNTGINAGFIEGDAFTFPFKLGSCDLVLMSCTRHLMASSDRKKLLEIVRSVLRPGGIVIELVLSVRDEGFGKGEETEPGTFDHKGKQMHFFTRKEMEQDYAAFNLVTLEEKEIDEVHSNGDTHKHQALIAIARKAS